MHDHEIDSNEPAEEGTDQAHPTGAGRDGEPSPDGVMNWSERVLGEVNKVFVGQRKLVAECWRRSWPRAMC